MIIGYNGTTYAHRRNIVGKVESATYKLIRDRFSVSRAVRERLGRITPQSLYSEDLETQFSDFGLNRVDLIHFFNGVSYGRTPWISTFETMLPRVSTARGLSRSSPGHKALPPLVEKGLRALASDPCRRLLALSRCTARIQESVLRARADLGEAIRSKIEVLHPPQEAHFDSFSEKPLDDDAVLRFMFVGRLFGLKGGREVLSVFSRLVGEGLPLRLTVVSSIARDPRFVRESAKEIEGIRRTLSDASWIDWYPTLDNESVLALMETTHVGLLPTYADTYGYVVLEFQACGCPVISTDVRALPEINNADVGWVIRVATDDLREGMHRTRQGRERLTNKISLGLEDTVRSIAEEPQLVRKKGQGSLVRVRSLHAPSMHARRLLEIYREALA